MRVRREPAGRVRLLLTESVELVGAEASLEERARVHCRGRRAPGRRSGRRRSGRPGRGRSGCGRPRRGSRTTRRSRCGRRPRCGALRPVHGDRGVPAQPCAEAALDLFVARKLRLVLRSDGVDVVGGRDHGHTEVQVFRLLKQAEHDLATALVPLLLDDRAERVVPLRCLFRVPVDVVHRVRVLIIYRHLDLFLVEIDPASVTRHSRLRRWRFRPASIILGVGFLIRCAHPCHAQRGATRRRSMGCRLARTSLSGPKGLCSMALEIDTRAPRLRTSESVWRAHSPE